MEAYVASWRPAVSSVVSVVMFKVLRLNVNFSWNKNMDNIKA